MSRKRFCIVCLVHKENFQATKSSELYFRFPKDEDLKLKWIKILQLDGHKLVARAKVCGLHFNKDQLGRGQTYLKRKALPEPVHVTQSRLRKRDENQRIVSNYVNILPKEIKCSPITSAIIKSTSVAPNPHQPFQKITQAVSTFNLVYDKLPLQNVNFPTQVTTIVHNMNPLSRPFVIKNAQNTAVRNIPAKLQNTRQTPTAQQTQTTTKSTLILPRPRNCPKTGSMQLKSSCTVRNKIKWARQRISKMKDNINVDKTFASNPTFLQFIKMQIKRYSKHRSNYDSFEKTLALAVYYLCKKQGYKQLLRLGLKLPAISTVLGWVTGFTLHTGINENLFSCIKKLMEDKSEKDRDCLLMWDEISIKEFIEYNRSTDSFEGIVDDGTTRTLEAADEALVIMISGINSKWKFPLSFYFSKNATTSDTLERIILDHIRKLREIEIRVRFGVCDMSFTNQGLYRKWNITPNSPSFKVDGEDIIFIHDTPHLIKLVRNNLEKRDFIQEKCFDNNKTCVKISWSHIRSFYNNDKKTASRMAPKLTDAHINLRDYSKMKVRLAVQVLSHSVACGITAMCELKILPTTALNTAYFIEMFDEIFDFLNMSKVKENKMGRSAAYFFSRMTKIDEYVSFIKSISIPALSRKAEFLDGLLLTLNGIKLLSSKLRSEGYSILFTRRCQQDLLEHFFSNIRSKAGDCRNPTARQFRLNFRYLFFTSMMGFPSNGNVEDVFERKINNIRIAFPFESVRELMKDPVSKEPENEPATQAKSFYTLNPKSKLKYGKLQETVVGPYIATASIVAVSNLKNCCLCQEMLLAQSADTVCHENTLLIDLKQISDDHRGLSYLNQEDSSVFDHTNHSFLKYATDTLKASGTEIIKGIFERYLRDKEVSAWVNKMCADHRSCILKYFIRADISTP